MIDLTEASCGWLANGTKWNFETKPENWTWTEKITWNQTIQTKKHSKCSQLIDNFNYFVEQKTETEV